MEAKIYFPTLETYFHKRGTTYRIDSSEPSRSVNKQSAKVENKQWFFHEGTIEDLVKVGASHIAEDILYKVIFDNSLPNVVTGIEGNLTSRLDSIKNQVPEYLKSDNDRTPLDTKEFADVITRIISKIYDAWSVPAKKQLEI